MHEFQDPSSRTRLAVAFVWIYLAASSLVTLLTLYAYLSPETFFDPQTLAIAGLAMVASAIVMVACIVVVAFWIHRVSANAHVLSNDMTISPGWAVGWYFVPIANLFKPYQGMKEAWMASHFRDNWHGEPTPALLVWWWALWLITNILANISFRIGNQYPDEFAPAPVAVLELVGGVLNVALCLILITMMKRLCAAQLYARHDETFA
jgi:hypothetical protein